jgi:hypothetical protein
MDTDSKQQGAVRKYEKPETKKHEALNTVQGSVLYYSSDDTYYYTTLYKPKLYYYY